VKYLSFLKFFFCLKIFFKCKIYSVPLPHHFTRNQSPSLPWRSNLSVKYPKLQVLGPGFVFPQPPYPPPKQKNWGRKPKVRMKTVHMKKSRPNWAPHLLNWSPSHEFQPQIWNLAWTVPELPAHNSSSNQKCSLKWNLANWVRTHFEQLHYIGDEPGITGSN
jgi:hypothetical protein